MTTTRPCQTRRLSLRSSTCRRLRRLHARSRTWSAVSHCAWCAALDRVDVSQKIATCITSHLPSVVSRVRCPVCRVSLLSHLSVVPCVFVLYVLPSQTVTRRCPFFFSRWPHFYAVPCPQPACFPRGPWSPTCLQVFVRMLGYVHNRQPTVFLRRKSECLVCTRQATDRDLESSSTMKSKSVNFPISCGDNVFGICKFCKNISVFFHFQKMFWN